MKRSLSKSMSIKLGRALIYIILIICTVICIAPFIWMVITSFKSTAEAYLFPPTFIPRKWMWANYKNGWAVADFPTFTKNTIFLALTCTIGTVISSALVAYGFAKFKAKMSGLLYVCLLGTMMLPAQVTLIPQYLLYYKMGLVDTYGPLLIPAWLGGGAYNIFLFRQFFLSLPKELNEAATIDGAGSFQTFWRIMLPSVKPVILAVGVMSLVWNWNDFYTPLIYLNSTSKFTLSIGLQFLNSSMGTTKIGQMMAVSVVTLLPVLIIFFVCQKYFVQGIKMQGLKA
ncbi:MAG TPA: carbohydrate ABC transporter permease [Clostridiales bacterium]|nr:carbohydrate ABC transporter permease [Clostridiales bacterium]HOL90926.1 carbohydrate ABC transporter permease [Clostridiales bacterium]